MMNDTEWVEQRKRNRAAELRRLQTRLHEIEQRGQAATIEVTTDYEAWQDQREFTLPEVPPQQTG